VQRVAVHARLALAGQVERRLGGRRAVGLVDLEHARGFLQLLHLARQPGLLAGALLVAAHRVGDLGQVARARGRHDGRLVGAVAHPPRRQAPSCSGSPVARRGLSAWYSAVTPSSLKRAAMVPNTGISSGAAPGFLVALDLLGHVAQRVGGALAVELVDGHELGEVQHVDLLELAGGAELRRHHVHGHVHQRHDGGVALADAGGLDDDQVEAGALQAAMTSGRAAEISLPKSRVASERMNTRGPCCHGEMAFMRMRSPSSAPPLLRRDGSMEMTATRRLSSWSRRRRRISSSVSEDLPAPPVPVMPSTGTVRAWRLARTLATSAASAAPFSMRRDELRQGAPVRSPWPFDGPGGSGREGDRSLSQRITISPIIPCQAHALAVLGAVDARDAVGLQLADLGRHDHAAAAAEHLDVLAAALAQQVDHVLEVLDVAALVGADGDALHVFLQGGGDDLVDAAVVAEVDHLGAHALQDAPHDVDGGVVAVEQAGRGDEAHLVGRAVVGERLEFGGQVGHAVKLCMGVPMTSTSEFSSSRTSSSE
jgi:hypothetical protein